MKNRLTNFGFWLGWTVLWRMPEPLIRKMFRIIADTSCLLNTRGVRQLSLNLRRVIGTDVANEELRKIVKAGMRNYLRYYCETFIVNRWSRSKIESLVRVENAENAISASKNGGIILALPHSGNWDLAGAWATGTMSQISTVAERLKPESVFQKFLKMRRDLGFDVVALTGVTGVYEFLRDSVRKGNTVPLLSDRDVAKNGMGIDFFGARASLPIGAALLALDTGRPIFTCSTWYDDKTLVITFDDEPIFVKSDETGRERLKVAQKTTSEIIQRLENHIKAHPQDWHMLQPVWKDLIA